MFLKMVQLFVPVVLFIFFVTQFLVPIFTGSPLFPLFNRKRARLEGALIEAAGDKEDERLRATVEAYRAKQIPVASATVPQPKENVDAKP